MLPRLFSPVFVTFRCLPFRGLPHERAPLFLLRVRTLWWRLFPLRIRTLLWCLLGLYRLVALLRALFLTLSAPIL